MIEVLTQWLEIWTSMPRGDHRAVSPYLAATYLISYIVILASLITVSIALLRYLRGHRHGKPVQSTSTSIALSLAFVAGCMLSALLPWHGLYWLHAIITGSAAMVSVAAAIGLWRSASYGADTGHQSSQELRDVIRQLEHEVGERRRAEQALQKSEELLHQLVAYQERVKEDERKRIAREIHDELGQNLMALRIDVSVLQGRIADVQPALTEKVELALGHIDTSIKAVRAIINNLRPSVLDLGLHAAIEWQVNEFERRTGIVCELTMDDEKSGLDLDDHRATALFRILQESLSNVARHARASMVQIDLCRRDNRFCMIIADNGVGLFPGCRRKPNSFGLLGIGERVSTLGGEFNVDSDPGRGTVLSVTIPVEVPVTMDE